MDPEKIVGLCVLVGMLSMTIGGIIGALCGAAEEREKAAKAAAKQAEIDREAKAAEMETTNRKLTQRLALYQQQEMNDGQPDPSLAVDHRRRHRRRHSCCGDRHSRRAEREQETQQDEGQPACDHCGQREARKACPAQAGAGASGDGRGSRGGT